MNENNNKTTENQYGAAIFFLCLLIYGLTNYGGIRSPDAEIVFRSAESFATEKTLSVSKPIEFMEEFGLAKAQDGKTYPVFGPLQSIVASPLVNLAEAVSNHHPEPEYAVPISHYYKNGLTNLIQHQSPSSKKPHVKRMVISYFNAMITSLCVLLFWFLCGKFTSNIAARLLTVFIFAFATPVWQYSSTFFSEPLTMLFTMMSFYLLIPNKNDSGAIGRTSMSGLFLGLATATHISAILFAPFFFLLAILQKGKPVRENLLKTGTFFSIGFSLILAILAAYNYSRFGNILETGRTVAPELVDKLGYGRFVAPFEGLYGLLFGSSKGLLLLAPIIILSFFGWRHFHRDNRLISFTIIAMSVFRLLFIASRSDWSGGFCLGPRYLLCLLPFLILPLTVFLTHLIEEAQAKKLLLILGIFLLAVFQQIYFALGEIFLFSHLVKFALLEQNPTDWLNLLQSDWRYSPLIRLHEVELLPHLLRNISESFALWSIVLVMLVSLPLIFTLFVDYKRADKL